jgi:hypothetical protein
MITFLLESMQKVIIKPVPYNKLRETTLDPTENIALFYSRLIEAMCKYTKLNPEEPEVLTILLYILLANPYHTLVRNFESETQDPKPLSLPFWIWP